MWRNARRTVVERLEQAGAILIGKTNLDQFATGLNGTRSPYGIPASAFNPDYISGGSSSGLGGRGGGRARVLRARHRHGRLRPRSRRLQQHRRAQAEQRPDQHARRGARLPDARRVSIFALTVADAARVAMTAIAFDGEDAFARSNAPPFTVEAAPAPLRVGVPIGPIPFFGDKDYEALYHASIERLAALGAVIVPIDFTPFARAASMLYAGPWVAERLLAVGDLATRNPEAIHEVVRGIILGAKGKSAAETFQALYDLAECIREARGEWAKADCLLLPTAGTTYTIAGMLADPVALNTNLGAYTNFVNLMDLAALAVPAGFRPDGIPFGVTLIGPALSDGMLAAIGDALHRSLTGARLGATSIPLSSTPPVTGPAKPATSVKVAVVGAHLGGQPLNWQLVEAQGEAPRNHPHRPWLSALRPCRYLARQTGPGVRWHRPGRHRGRSLGDGGEGVWVFRGL